MLPSLWAMPRWQFQEWAPFHGTYFKLEQSSVAHSHDFCATFTPEYLVGRGNCRSKVCGRLGVYIYLLLMCKVPFCTKDTEHKGEDSVKALTQLLHVQCDVEVLSSALGP